MPVWNNLRVTITRNKNGLYLFLVGLIVAVLAHYALQPDVLPVKQVVIKGNLTRVSNEQLQFVAKNKIAGYNVLTLDLLQIQQEFEQLSWVKTTEIKRLWPDRLEISIVERNPIARWSGGGLIDNHGVWFDASTDDELPIFEGARGMEKEMTRQYEQLQTVSSGMGERLKIVQLSDRGAWQVVFQSGVIVKLGRTESLLRLQRLEKIWKKYLKSQEFEIEYVDMRYPDGFALKLKKSVIKD